MPDLWWAAALEKTWQMLTETSKYNRILCAARKAAPLAPLAKLSIHSMLPKNVGVAA